MNKFLRLLLLLCALLPVRANAQQKTPSSVKVIATFTSPRPFASLTDLTGIANNGNLLGGYQLAAQDYLSVGFERTASGQFSPPILFPGSKTARTSTAALGINNSGLICGDFYTDTEHGFFYDGHTYTQYDVPGSTYTEVWAINDAGHFVGDTATNGVATGFLNIDGVLTLTSVPGARLTNAEGINNLDQVTGLYATNSLGYHGFLRNADGTLVAPLDYPGAPNTFLYGINDRGTIAGSWVDTAGSSHAFIFQPPAQFIDYAYPGATQTSLFGINNSNLITGDYVDTAGTYHGFLAQFSP